MVPKTFSILFGLSLLACLLVVVSAGHRSKDTNIGTGSEYGYRDYVDLDLFLKAYCKGSRGVYERCQRCIAVACVRELDHPRQLRKYQDCIDTHNRCCGAEGLHAENVPTAVECYGTGTYDSFVTGELATAEAVLGSQRSLKDLKLESKRRGD